MRGLQNAPLDELLSLPECREAINKRKREVAAEIDAAWNAPAAAILRDKKWQLAIQTASWQ
jgi:hypothetical protein